MSGEYNSLSKIKISRPRNSTAVGNVEWWDARAMNESSVKKTENKSASQAQETVDVSDESFREADPIPKNELRPSSPQRSSELAATSHADPPSPEVSRLDTEVFLTAKNTFLGVRSGKPSHHSGGFVGSRALKKLDLAERRVFLPPRDRIETIAEDDEPATPSLTDGVRCDEEFETVGASEQIQKVSGVDDTRRDHVSPEHGRGAAEEVASVVPGKAFVHEGENSPAGGDEEMTAQVTSEDEDITSDTSPDVGGDAEEEVVGSGGTVGGVVAGGAIDVSEDMLVEGQQDESRDEDNEWEDQGDEGGLGDDEGQEEKAAPQRIVAQGQGADVEVPEEGEENSCAPATRRTTGMRTQAQHDNRHDDPSLQASADVSSNVPGKADLKTPPVDGASSTITRGATAQLHTSTDEPSEEDPFAKASSLQKAGDPPSPLMCRGILCLPAEGFQKTNYDDTDSSCSTRCPSGQSTPTEPSSPCSNHSPSRRGGNSTLMWDPDHVEHETSDGKTATLSSGSRTTPSCLTEYCRGDSNISTQLENAGESRQPASCGESCIIEAYHLPIIESCIIEA